MRDVGETRLASLQRTLKSEVPVSLFPHSHLTLPRALPQLLAQGGSRLLQVAKGGFTMLPPPRCLGFISPFS